MNSRTKERCAERLLAEPVLQHDEAQAATFSVTAMESPSARLDQASLPLFGAAGLDLRGQARALADVLTNQLCLCPERRDHRALLIDHALSSRSAHPLQIAVIGHELGRRAGLATFVGSYGSQPWTVVCAGSRLALDRGWPWSGRRPPPASRPRLRSAAAAPIRSPSPSCGRSAAPRPPTRPNAPSVCCEPCQSVPVRPYAAVSTCVLGGEAVLCSVAPEGDIALAVDPPTK
jgi:hypothetical protein